MISVNLKNKIFTVVTATFFILESLVQIMMMPLWSFLRSIALASKYTIEFSLKYMILVTLAIKAYIGRSKINSAKKLPPVGIELGTLGLLL